MVAVNDLQVMRTPRNQKSGSGWIRQVPESKGSEVRITAVSILMTMIFGFLHFSSPSHPDISVLHEMFLQRSSKSPNSNSIS